MQNIDVLIIGAGAAGLMCAIEAGKRGRSVLVIDHAKRPADKIRISGGGRCNFTNLHASPANYLSENPRFAVSALKRFTQHDFIALVDKHRISWHEKTLGQLFCDDSAQQIIDMLLQLCQQSGVRIQLGTSVTSLTKPDDRFTVGTSRDTVRAQSVVVACGGPSIPKMGATGFGYEIAKQFDLPLVSPRAALVPFVFDDAMRERTKHLAGVSVDAVVSFKKTSFREGLLFTHRGLSGPSILQISSYWEEGKDIRVNLLPDTDVLEALKSAKQSQPKQDIKTAVASLLPKKLATHIAEEHKLSGRLADTSDKVLRKAALAINEWTLKPVGTEGYRTAEVTLGGVSTKTLSSKTMETSSVPGLFFIGEVVDVTGHLGGFNFQWAWSSGHAAGQFV
ncbi:Fumarate reductase flavoprotein subunit precursor [Pseudovibrio sp. W64]|uniref:NAD(P)/FAD-dependent oxidoreductase n=1 Tax=unclassified Pseudovibrio TaxID=2627060 RepID=UPI0007AE6F90|nr:MULTISPECIES: NAD(P)/FAD-dependent oxidoreductase [unclassified Pseudovibrio]KZK79101.1 Fumarate reductase flavoprotein subunit precursor [Pseudovibrio sp. W64]KZK93956.1 Fumarate reductase flavoprotein subunit precursor [Pseudovibrio sp. Ad46]